MSGSLSATGGVGALLQIADPSGAKYYPTYDGNGNVASLVNAGTGALAAVYEYGPFGEIQRAEVLDQVIADQPFRFSTKFYDTETRLVYYGRRYYDPANGRFINRDPIGEQGGLNLYGFVGNDPVNRVDYLGMNPPDGIPQAGEPYEDPVTGIKYKATRCFFTFCDWEIDLEAMRQSPPSQLPAEIVKADKWHEPHDPASDYAQTSPIALNYYDFVYIGGGGGDGGGGGGPDNSAPSKNAPNNTRKNHFSEKQCAGLRKIKEEIDRQRKAGKSDMSINESVARDLAVPMVDFLRPGNLGNIFDYELNNENSNGSWQIDPVMLPVGVRTGSTLDFDWFVQLWAVRDRTQGLPFHPVSGNIATAYTFGKVLNTANNVVGREFNRLGAKKMTYPLPFTDPGENTAVALTLFRIGPVSVITDEFIKRECP